MTSLLEEKRLPLQPPVFSGDTVKFHPDNFADCVFPKQKHEYFCGLLGNSLEANLKKLDPMELFAIAEWAATDLNGYAFGPHANEDFSEFFDAFRDVYKTKLDANQQKEIEVLIAVAAGVDEDDSAQIKQAFRERLEVFLGDESQIDSIDTVEKAKDVAFTLFGGVRQIEENSPAIHLAHLLYVGNDGDVDVIKGVMHRLRALQMVHFTGNGFGDEQAVIPGDYEDEWREDTMVDVWVATGRRCYESYIAGKADGRALFGLDELGMVVDTQEDQVTLKETAKIVARDNFDDPIVLKIQVMEKYILEDEDEKRVFIESTGPFSVVEQVSVPFVIKSLPRENLSECYPDLSPELIRRMETLLFDAEPLFPVPQPEGGGEYGKKIVKAALFLIGAFALYKYALRPLFFRAREWWKASP